MEKRNFKHHYRKLQKAAVLSDEARCAIALAVREEAKRATSISVQTGVGEPSQREAPTDLVMVQCDFPHSRRRQGVVAFVACVALVLVGFIIVGITGEGEAKERFAIQAYAAESGMVQPSRDGLIAFGYGDMVIAPPEEGGGVFTACMFQVPQEGIKRVEASIDRGELYQCDEEWVELGVNQQAPAMAEIELLMNSKGDYQASIAKVGVDYRARVLRFKRLGASASVDITDAMPVRFGIWLPDSAEQGGALQSIDWLEGARLTVSVYLDDGVCETKVIRLHAGFLKTMEYEENGYSVVVATPELADTPDSQACYTLYGVVER